MKLNLGCGYRKKEGYLNVDKDPICRPDKVVDFEKFPWPFEDNTFSEVLADHVLEHLGPTPDLWLGIWKELWRVCQNGAVIHIVVPHPRHDNFLIDPTHVRPVYPTTIAMFDQIRNIRNHEENGQETKLGLMCGIDVEVSDIQYQLLEPWASAVQQKQMPMEQLQHQMITLNNVCQEIRFKAKVIKPARGRYWIKAFIEGDEAIRPVAPESTESV